MPKSKNLEDCKAFLAELGIKNMMVTREFVGIEKVDIDATSLLEGPFNAGDIPLKKALYATVASLSSTSKEEDGYHLSVDIKRKRIDDFQNFDKVDALRVGRVARKYGITLPEDYAEMVRKLESDPNCSTCRRQQCAAYGEFADCVHSAFCDVLKGGERL